MINNPKLQKIYGSSYFGSGGGFGRVHLINATATGESDNGFVAGFGPDTVFTLESGSTEGWFGPGRRIVIERDPWGLGAISVWNGCQNVARYQSDRVGDYFLVGPYAVRADQEAIKILDRA